MEFTFTDLDELLSEYEQHRSPNDIAITENLTIRLENAVRALQHVSHFVSQTNKEAVLGSVPRVPVHKSRFKGPNNPGGYSIYLWVARCGAAPHTLTLFKTNIADFPTLFTTEFRFFNTLFKTFNPNIN